MQSQKDINSQQQEVDDHRRQLREAFLFAQGLSKLTVEPMQADASFRRYYRLRGDDKPMLLMQDPPDRPPVPPLVMVEPFVKISDHLRAIGLRTPMIYAQDLPNGLLLLEDFGDDTYTRLFNKGVDSAPLYELAVDTLLHLNKHPDSYKIDIPPYDIGKMVDEAMLLLDWYYPAQTGKEPSEEMKESYAYVWFLLLEGLPTNQKTLVLRDFHVDNLMLTADGQGIGRCGLLDFQDALIGNFSYDLMSLLEDARRDIAPDLKERLYDRYVDSMGASLDKEAFDYSFRVLAAQRHAKVLGIFMRLSMRDGKNQYLKFMPHVHKLFMETLRTPEMTSLKQWFRKNKFDIGSYTGGIAFE